MKRTYPNCMCVCVCQTGGVGGGVWMLSSAWPCVLWLTERYFGGGGVKQHLSQERGAQQRRLGIDS